MQQFKNILLNNIDSFNRSNKSIHIELLDNDAIEQRYIEFGMDYRFKDEILRKSLLLFAYLDNSTNEILALSTLVVFGKSDYSNIVFWNYREKEKLLNKISIKDFKEYKGDYVVTLGYTQTAKTFKRKYRSAMFIIDLINDIIDKTDILVFAECTGIPTLNANVVKTSTVIYDDDSEFRHEHLGATRKESIPVEKLVKVLKFKKANNIYNIWTLGQVYFNKELYCD